jgi:hypothetical protein
MGTLTDLQDEAWVRGEDPWDEYIADPSWWPPEAGDYPQPEREMDDDDVF